MLAILYLEKLGIVQELENVIKSGEYKKFLKGQEIISEECSKLPLPVTVSDQELMPPPAKVNSQPIVPDIAAGALQVQNKAPAEAPEDEDNAIQNLLDDIRGSFERQFDDEFNDLTDTAASEGDFFSSYKLKTSSMIMLK